MTLEIKTTKENLDYLFQCNKESARVWNECVRLNKELWLTKSNYVNQKYLQDNIKGCFSSILTAKCMQIICKKYMSAITGINKARKQGRTDEKYPWKQKKNYNTMWDIQALQIDYDKNIIRIPRPQKIINGKRILNPIFLKFKELPPNILQIELVYRNGLKLAVNYYEDVEYLQINSSKTVAVDLGEIHSITSCDTEGKSLIVTGRQLRSYQRFRNKELGKLERRLSKCKKNSRNYRRYRKTIRKLLNKTNNKINYNIHKTSKMFSDYMIMNNIHTVVVGDLTKFNMNLKQKKVRKGCQQKLVQWEHGKIIKKIKEKTKNYGINVVEISEAYTSQTCPCCGNKHKPIGRNYVCDKCGFTMHRDLVGAYNILSKYINNGVIKKLDIEVKPIKYLRIDC